MLIMPKKIRVFFCVSQLTDPNFYTVAKESQPVDQPINSLCVPIDSLVTIYAKTRIFASF